MLRGAASSLYGNVALTAVVNLITKVGKEVNGLQASYSMGNNQTYKGNLLFGQGNYNSDLLMWASLYHSQGEKFDIPWTSGLHLCEWLQPETYLRLGSELCLEPVQADPQSSAWQTGQSLFGGYYVHVRL